MITTNYKISYLSLISIGNPPIIFRVKVLFNCAKPATRISDLQQIGILKKKVMYRFLERCIPSDFLLSFFLGFFPINGLRLLLRLLDSALISRFFLGSSTGTLFLGIL